MNPTLPNYQIPPEVAQLANEAALRAWGSDDPLVPLVNAAMGVVGQPLAYGMPDGDVFPWTPQAATLAGVVRLFSREEIIAYQKAKAAQGLQTPSGVADHLQDLVRRSEEEIALRGAAMPTREAMANAKTESVKLAQDRQQLMNLFRAP